MRIVLDTDPGIDDALAILYLAAQADVEIVAVGSVHGNVPAQVAADNSRRILDVLGLDAVPVAVGAARPLAQPLLTSEFVHGPHGLGRWEGPEPSRPAVRESAAEQIVQLARQHPGELDLLALGPLTNVALALLLEPELPSLLRSVMVMGGAVDAPGNATPFAEANIWHDPEAADLVFAAGFALTLVALDVTHSARADADWLDTLAASTGPRGKFAHDVLGFYVDFYSRMLGERCCTLYDPLAAAILLHPDLATYRELPVSVELRGEKTRGQTVADLRGYGKEISAELGGITDRPAIKVARTVDGQAFFKQLTEALIDRV
ncbi:MULTISPECIES: nucleoside hydrolase [unclassified Crossiella]|uniref:nucleoside hydrolase n=1 Tax=unclassified Crossiella TaxID=2620835 RepID=UPI001FFF108B|nr:MULTISPECIES: nucleoside hydrolase [unclassified Crossiella]MCK2240468.1 nucleoside hydrolase [Crossiella sp. S99.2]MCK2253081.1 nucleoside hydrolase [Crossiella sp. S99.1]